MKRIISVILCIALFATFMPIAFAEDSTNISYNTKLQLIDSGNTGYDDGINWNLYDNGCLVFTGKGPMGDYCKWDTSKVKYVEICEGITEINISSFCSKYFDSKLIEIKIHKSVTAIYDNGDLPNRRNAKIGLCYSGSQKMWEDLLHSYYSEGAFIITYNSKRAAPYVKLSGSDIEEMGMASKKRISVESYYLGEYADSTIEWTLDDSLESQNIMGTTIYVSASKIGKYKVKAELKSKDGKVIASDEKTLKVNAWDYILYTISYPFAFVAACIAKSIWDIMLLLTIPFLK